MSFIRLHVRGIISPEEGQEIGVRLAKVANTSVRYVHAPLDNATHVFRGFAIIELNINRPSDQVNFVKEKDRTKALRHPDVDRAIKLFDKSKLRGRILSVEYAKPDYKERLQQLWELEAIYKRKQELELEETTTDTSPDTEITRFVPRELKLRPSKGVVPILVRCDPLELSAATALALASNNRRATRRRATRINFNDSDYPSVPIQTKSDTDTPDLENYTDANNVNGTTRSAERNNGTSRSGDDSLKERDENNFTFPSSSSSSISSNMERANNVQDLHNDTTYSDLIDEIQIKVEQIASDTTITENERRRLITDLKRREAQARTMQQVQARKTRMNTILHSNSLHQKESSHVLLDNEGNTTTATTGTHSNETLESAVHKPTLSLFDDDDDEVDDDDQMNDSMFVSSNQLPDWMQEVENDITQDSNNHISTLSESNETNDFMHKPQFDGPKGKRLFELQRRFGVSDPRFQIDARFVEETPNQSVYSLHGSGHTTNGSVKNALSETNLQQEIQEILQSEFHDGNLNESTKENETEADDSNPRFMQHDYENKIGFGTGSHVGDLLETQNEFSLVLSTNSDTVVTPMEQKQTFSILSQVLDEPITPRYFIGIQTKYANNKKVENSFSDRKTNNRIDLRSAAMVIEYDTEQKARKMVLDVAEKQRQGQTLSGSTAVVAKLIAASVHGQEALIHTDLHDDTVVDTALSAIRSYNGSERMIDSRGYTIQGKAPIIPLRYDPQNRSCNVLLCSTLRKRQIQAEQNQKKQQLAAIERYKQRQEAISATPTDTVLDNTSNKRISSLTNETANNDSAPHQPDSEQEELVANTSSSSSASAFSQLKEEQSQASGQSQETLKRQSQAPGQSQQSLKRQSQGKEQSLLTEQSKASAQSQVAEQSAQSQGKEQESQPSEQRDSQQTSQHFWTMTTQWEEFKKSGVSIAERQLGTALKQKDTSTAFSFGFSTPDTNSTSIFASKIDGSGQTDSTSVHSAVHSTIQTETDTQTSFVPQTNQHANVSHENQKRQPSQTNNSFQFGFPVDTPTQTSSTTIETYGQKSALNNDTAKNSFFAMQQKMPSFGGGEFDDEENEADPVYTDMIHQEDQLNNVPTPKNVQKSILAAGFSFTRKGASKNTKDVSNKEILNPYGKRTNQSQDHVETAWIAKRRQLTRDFKRKVRQTRRATMGTNAEFVKASGFSTKMHNAR